MSLANTPAPAYSNDDVHQSQRLMTSTFGGSDYFCMPAVLKYQQVGNAGFTEKFQDRQGKIETNQRDNIGLASSFLSIEHRNRTTTPTPLTRRLSLPSSSGTIESGDDSFEADIDDILDSTSSPIDNTGESISTSTVLLSPLNSQVDHRIPRDVLYKNLANFVAAMDESTKTQQAIHDWDRKMGLKRSHCKTMRSTTQSRKMVRRMLKKDINALARSRRPKKSWSSIAWRAVVIVHTTILLLGVYQPVIRPYILLFDAIHPPFWCINLARSSDLAHQNERLPSCKAAQNVDDARKRIRLLVPLKVIPWEAADNGLIVRYVANVMVCMYGYVCMWGYLQFSCLKNFDYYDCTDFLYPKRKRGYSGCFHWMATYQPVLTTATTKPGLRSVDLSLSLDEHSELWVPTQNLDEKPSRFDTSCLRTLSIVLVHTIQRARPLHIRWD